MREGCCICRCEVGRRVSASICAVRLTFCGLNVGSEEIYNNDFFVKTYLVRGEDKTSQKNTNTAPTVPGLSKAYPNHTAVTAHVFSAIEGLVHNRNRLFCWNFEAFVLEKIAESKTLLSKGVLYSKLRTSCTREWKDSEPLPATDGEADRRALSWTRRHPSQQRSPTEVCPIQISILNQPMRSMGMVR